VLERVPTSVAGYPVRVIVVDDGSRDATASIAEAAGVRVVRHQPNRGLGAAVRSGFASAQEENPVAIAFCDADGEYAPEELEAMVTPILRGDADYVVGSRFLGQPERMLRRRRAGNQTLTFALRLLSRAPITDGQSGYRAFSPEAAAAVDVIHDYNYAQVITLDLLGKGFRYAEIPITYRFRETGESFVKLGTYLRKVGPAVWKQWRVNLRRRGRGMMPAR
jgi:glycosyltransferase involved in cell wall biosynthesis